MLDSPSRNDSTDANSKEADANPTEADPKKFRIPKKNRVAATLAFVQQSNFLTTDNDNLDATVTEIFSETLTEMP